MGNDVFANGREVSCKAADGKSICAFPDVCMTPPENPATPPGVPIPYPNTGMASDMTSGSKNVKISNKEVILKNKSYFKKSTGDEAGCAAKKGVVTSKIQGKVYFNSWSMDVKFEGENVVRHLDLTTHNHASAPGNSPPWVYQDEAATIPIKECKKEVAKMNTACAGKSKDEQCADRACKDAKRCLLVSKRQADSTVQDSQVACCDGESGHHIVEAHAFTVKGSKQKIPLLQFPNYDAQDAPCICAQCPQAGRGRFEGEHGEMHSILGKLEQAAIESAPTGKKDYAWNYGQAKAAGTRAIHQTFPRSKCSKACIKKQLDRYHNKIGAKDKTPLRTEPPGLSDDQKWYAHESVPRESIIKW